MQADEIFDLVVYVVPVIVQCGVLAKMAKSVRLGARNVEEMQQNLTKYPGTDYILKYRKNWQFILAAMVVIGLNFVIVWWCWM